MLNTKDCLFNGGHVPLFPFRRLGVDIVTSLVICAVCKAKTHLNPQTVMFPQNSSSLDLYPEHCFSVNRTHLYGSGHKHFAKEFQCRHRFSFTGDNFLVILSPGNFLPKWTVLKYVKDNYPMSDTRSLNPNWPPSRDELDFLLASRTC